MPSDFHVKELRIGETSSSISFGGSYTADVFDLSLSDFAEVRKGHPYPEDDRTGEHLFKARFFANGHKYGHARFIPAGLHPDLIAVAVKKVATEAGTIVQWDRLRADSPCMIGDCADCGDVDQRADEALDRYVSSGWESVHPRPGWPRKAE